MGESDIIVRIFFRDDLPSYVIFEDSVFSLDIIDRNMLGKVIQLLQMVVGFASQPEASPLEIRLFEDNGELIPEGIKGDQAIAFLNKRLNANPNYLEQNCTFMRMTTNA